jgi:HPt (histidine-containing phosphotransfer) domain-containing protein
MIDWDRLNELRSEIGDDDFAEVVELFLLEADEVIARISVSSGPATLEADLHFLKGAALNLGFRAFAALCQVGEKRAAAGRCDIDLGPVTDCYQQSKTALLKGAVQAAAG